MISVFRLPNNRTNNPVSYLHIRISVKLNKKHARIRSHSFLDVTRTLQQTDAVQTLCIAGANEQQKSLAHRFVSWTMQRSNNYSEWGGGGLYVFHILDTDDSTRYTSLFLGLAMCQ